MAYVGSQEHSLEPSSSDFYKDSEVWDNSFLAFVSDVMKPIIIGIFGGIAAIFVSGKQPNASTISYAIFVSGFAGWLAGKFATAIELSPDYRDVVVGIAGFLGASFLAAIARFVMSKVGLDKKD